jgi:hypothetical protein
VVVKFITNFSNLIIFLKSEKLFKNIINFRLNSLQLIKVKFMLKACSSVDRASDSDSESQGFDSLHAYENFKNKI